MRPTSTLRHVLIPAVALLVPMTGAGSAAAADLGGSCCADLEERIAELEATTVRKGNRKLKLEVFGQVNTAILIWDDGNENDAYVVDNDFNSSRVGFRGTAKIAEGVKAGYLIEAETNHAASDATDQVTPSPNSQTLDLRFAHWYLEFEKIGKVTLGETSSVTDNLYKFGNISGSFSDSELHYNGRFFLRSNMPGFTSTSLRWDTIANNLDTSRGQFLRYDSPSFGGFVASAAWGQDDIWDVSLRYTGEISGFKLAGAIGYVEDMDGLATTFGDEPEDIIGSAGVHHLASGLYIHVAAGQRDADVRPGFDDTAQYFYVQAGVDKTFNAFGATTIYADYGHYSDWGAGSSFDRNVTVAGGPAANNSRVVDSEVQRWGFGATQKFDSAAHEVYGVFNWYQADVIGVPTAGGASFDVPVEDWFSATLGSRIKF